ncbi:DUF7782 domain-containing protein [Mycolicibacterium brumae]|uniref:Methyltransferase n=1 Tax=Mycolicibacterium brumae TaxID=85968 RepID=A0A2G5PC16_9MYCO|nr:methyltransferase [Mycolicibacterium brumae]MCV7193203.1 methyltransferase [Mycolicibacterium brumae]PIB75889.1 methyltransferase [Mycolicibacterium brumae]RWA16640.1 hypothetical protein MBRU_07910 [Mycolicibacterium brumae DSM 44177]UWW09858.1 methyltransferase [Mycolicibacterium brumae]
MSAYPLADPAVVDTLGADLRAAGYTDDGVAELLGPDVHAALRRGLLWPALRATETPSPLGTVLRLFQLGAEAARSDIENAFPATGFDALIDNSVLRAGPAGAAAALDIRPHRGPLGDLLVIADQDAALRGGPVGHDHVLGVGGASMSLARAVIRQPVRRALDLGTGCGVQALHLDAHCEQIVATDTNPRALALAAATAGINRMSWDLRAGSLFEPVAGERFDLIVSNPPFVVGAGERDYEYRDSGVAGDGLCRQLIAQVGDHLEPGGVAQIMANWVVRDGDDWRDRIGGWLADTGLDAWVVQREFADPVSYVALWTADAGETAAQRARRGGAWLDWFAAENIAGVGMGMITLRAGGRAEPLRVCEELTGPDDALTGGEVAAFFGRMDYLDATGDDALLAARLSTPPVLLEQHSLPGPAGWQQISAVVRRPGGPGAELGVDEVFTALLAGCRGEVPLGTLIELLAAHHGVDADALAEAALPVVREAVARGILHQTPVK